MSTRVFDDGSSLESEPNLAKKEVSVVVANIDQFGPTTSKFLESPAADLYSVRCMLKSKGWST